MNSINAIVFRYLTDADYFNINKPTGTEEGGGGQSYIDFPITDISIPQWKYFFSDIIDLRESTETVSPIWLFPIYSIGLPKEMKQKLKIYQRRNASVSIAAQKIHSRRSNRVWAWHPICGFPKPADQDDRHQLPPGLAVYLVKTNNGEVWAGWFQGNLSDKIGILPTRDEVVLNFLSNMFTKVRKEGDAGMLYCGGDKLMLNEDDQLAAISPSNNLKSSMIASLHLKDAKSSDGTETTTSTKKKSAKIIQKRKATYSQITQSEKKIIDSLFSEDSKFLDSVNENTKTRYTRIRKRNYRAVADLKKLYKHKCQISGRKYLFRKKDGDHYTEAHHLIPLGEGGADSPLNIVILSPLLHRMLHYADVENIDLSKIKANPDGSAKLEIKINNKKFAITWTKGHYKMIMKYQSNRNND